MFKRTWPVIPNVATFDLDDETLTWFDMTSIDDPKNFKTFQ